MNLTSFGSPLLQVREINNLIAQNTDISLVSKKPVFGTITATLFLFILTVSSFLTVWLMFQDSLVSDNQYNIQQLRNFSFGCGILAFSLVFLIK